MQSPVTAEAFKNWFSNKNSKEKVDNITKITGAIRTSKAVGECATGRKRTNENKTNFPFVNWREIPKQTSKHKTRLCSYGINQITCCRTTPDERLKLTAYENENVLPETLMGNALWSDVAQVSLDTAKTVLIPGNLETLPTAEQIVAGLRTLDKFKAKWHGAHTRWSIVHHKNCCIFCHSALMPPSVRESVQWTGNWNSNGTV